MNEEDKAWLDKELSDQLQDMDILKAPGELLNCVERLKELYSDTKRYLQETEKFIEFLSQKAPGNEYRIGSKRFEKFEELVANIQMALNNYENPFSR